MALQFRKAVKYNAKGRVALVGPAGSGKSYTMLTLARALAGPTGKIAAIDTEHGSLSKYADLFDFDVIELESFSPDNFMGALTAAEESRYDVFCGDSLSHFWTGKDGALEFVDMKSKIHKDQMGGWKDFRPYERAMVDRMIASPCHVIVTMRTKTEYAEEVDPRSGKKKRVKIGLQPVQREGLEYEFDLVGYMDDDNSLIVDKTRCPAYAGKAITKPGAAEFSPFIDWLKGEQRTVTAPATIAPPVASTPPPAQAEAVNGHRSEPTPQNGNGSHGPTSPQPRPLTADQCAGMLEAMRGEFAQMGHSEAYARCLELHAGGPNKRPATLGAARKCVAELERLRETMRAEQAVA